MADDRLLLPHHLEPLDLGRGNKAGRVLFRDPDRNARTRRRVEAQFEATTCHDPTCGRSPLSRRLVARDATPASP